MAPLCTRLPAAKGLTRTLLLPFLPFQAHYFFVLSLAMPAAGAYFFKQDRHYYSIIVDHEPKSACKIGPAASHRQ
jgi:hypothetical protein